MFLKTWQDRITGYVRISVEGYFIERFINICMSKSILLWNTKREKASVLHANVAKKDFKKLRQIAKIAKCKIRLEEKKGLPFLLYKYRKRKLFFLFLVLVCLCIVSLSNFLWNIEIEGNEKIPAEEILQILETEGMKIGMSKSKLDTKSVIQKIRLDRADIAWVGIEMNGTNAVVKIVEAQEKPQMINPEEYCDIVSDKEGVILKVHAQNGIPMVKVGDVVKKGSILISGKIEGKYTDPQYVHSEGEIEARVWYTKKMVVNYKQNKTTHTGNEEKKYGIVLHNFRINFYKTLSKFEKYDTIEKVEKLKLFSNFYLPISFISITNQEKKSEPVTYSEQEVINQGVEVLQEKLEKEIGEGKQVLNKKVNYTKQKNAIEVELIYEVLEKIGTKEKIVG